MHDIRCWILPVLTLVWACPTGVIAESLLTVGDSPNLKPDGVTPYRLVGIPDGLGAYDNGNGTLTLLVDHELASGEGIARAHGGNAAFVSRWTIDSSTREVLHGQDLIQRVYYFDTSTLMHTYLPNALIYRLCSADLAVPTAYYNQSTGLGTLNRIFTSGEESSTVGRGFAHVATGPDAGSSYELAGLGNYQFENVATNPRPSDLTIVVGTDDSSSGELYVYVGTKKSAGNDIERAGLVGGVLFGVRLAGIPNEPIGAISPTPFDLHGFGDVSIWNGLTLRNASGSNNVTKFARPEDAHWNPRDPRQLIFATTGSGGVPSRLWRLTFHDLLDPASGGTAEILISSADGPQNMDNLTLDPYSNVLIQEDRGSSSALARIWNYNLRTGDLTVLAQADRTRFISGPDFLTTNEESSGIIDARDLLGPGWFLLTVQAHYSPGDAELVQGGQLLTLFSPLSAACTDADITTQGAGSAQAGYGVPDGLVTASDIMFFVNAWIAPDLMIADVNTEATVPGDPDYGTPDGTATAADINYFVGSWLAGCP